MSFADLVRLAQNYNRSTSSAALLEAGASAKFVADWALAQSLVPEPMSLMAIGLSSSLLLRRQR